MSEERQFPRWEDVYREEVERLPWFYLGLDPDLEQALEARGVTSGRILDLGTGPGTQAIALARRGLEVTATDLAGRAIERASARASNEGVRVDFRQDDILDSRLEATFDYVFDRGCFHTLSPEHRPDYVKRLHALVREGGVLFLKCFSHLQPGESGPHRFRPEQLRALFEGPFRVLSIQDTVYQGTLDPFPRALFCELERA